MLAHPTRARPSYRHWQPIITRWSDNDAYGHVNNAIYYRWFDTAVNDWLIEGGMLEVGHGDMIGLVVETNCRYFSPLSYPQRVGIGLGVERIGTSSVIYRLGAFEVGADHPSTEASFAHVYVDRVGRRPTAMPATMKARLTHLPMA